MKSRLKIALRHYSSAALCPRAEEFLEEQMFPMKGPDYGPGGEQDSRAPWLPVRGRSPRAPESRSRLVNGTHTHLNSQLLSGNCQVGPWLSPSWSPCSVSIATASPSSGASPGPARPSPPSALSVSSVWVGTRIRVRQGPGCFSQGRSAFMILLRRPAPVPGFSSAQT